MEDDFLENTKSKARDLLTCNLCGGTFFDPRRLPCAHSFCRRCLQAYHESISNGGSIRLGSFRCPTCNAQIGIPRGGVSFFPVDKRIGDIKEKVVDEMQDILRKKLLARKGMSDTGLSFDSSDTESQNSDNLSHRRTRGVSHGETDPSMHQGKSRSFERYHSFTSEMSSSSRSRFDRQRPVYSSLRETHRRKAQDLLAAFDHQIGLSQTDESVSTSSTSRESLYTASATSFHAESKSFNNSSRFETHRTEDAPKNFSTNSSSSTMADDESAGSFTNASSASGYYDDRNSMFLKNHRGYESLREKSSRRTYLGEDTFSNFSGKAAGEPKHHETRQNSGDFYGRYAQENDTGSVPVDESDSLLESAAARLKTASDHIPESVSGPSHPNHARKDRVDFERPAETVTRTAFDDHWTDQNGEIPESMTSMSQPQFRRSEHYARLKKPSFGRTKLLGAFISPLSTAHEELVLEGNMSVEENVPSNGTKNRLHDFTNTSLSKTNRTADLSCIESDMNVRQTLSETVNELTRVSGKVPLENLNNYTSLEEEVEVMQEFDFLLAPSSECDETDLDSKRSDSSASSINCAIDKTSLPEPHSEQHSQSSCPAATPQGMHGAKVADSAVTADEEVINKSGFAENGFRVSHKECMSTSSDPLSPTYRVGYGGKAKASRDSLSSLLSEDNMKHHDDPNLLDDNDDDDDDDTLVYGRASEEEEDNCFDQLPSVSSSVTGNNTTTAGRIRGSPRVKRRKKTVNEGTATLHHISPEVYLMPTGVAILSQGSTVVADYGIGCLQYYADDGSPLHKIEGMKPFSIAVNSAKNQVIVGDRRRKTVLLFDECGCDVAQWDANMFKWICGIGILCNGDLVILDREKSQIGIYKPNGQHVHTFGSYGNDDCQLCMAEFLVVDSMDRIIVSDSGNHCIKVFSITGALLQKFGSRGCDDGEMQWPKGICTDESNNIIVADTCNSRVSMFSSDGSFLQHLVTNITMPYAVSYSSPNVAVTRYTVMGQSQFLLYSISNKS